MNKCYLCRLMGMLLLLNTIAIHASQTLINETIELNITIGMYQEHKEPLEWILEYGDGACISIEQLAHPDLNYIRENTVILDFLTLCHALKIGGVEANFSFIYYPVAARLLREMKKGNIMLAGFTMWAKEAEANELLASLPVVENGEFEKIFYRAVSNKSFALIFDDESLNKYTVVSNPLWQNDWQLLSCLGVKTKRALSYQQMYLMLEKNKADLLLTLIATNEESFNRDLYGVKLTPLTGYKVRFNDELKFYANNAFPDAKMVIKAIDKGISKMKLDGTLKTIQYYQGIGVEYIKDWHVFEC